MKRRILLTITISIMIVLTCGIVICNAETVDSGYCGENAEWILDDSYTLMISGEGALFDYSTEETPPWYQYRKLIKKVTVEDNVSAIGSYSFYNCTGLVDVELSDTVNYIGPNSFSECISLLKVDVPENVLSIEPNTFYGCPKLSYVYLPDGLKSIGENAFYNCPSLGSIYIPEGIETIAASSSSLGPFVGCGDDFVIYCGEEENKWGTNWLSAGSFSYKNCVNYGFSREEYNYWIGIDKQSAVISIPEEYNRVPAKAFYRATNLTDVTLPEGVITIGYEAFYNCGKLQSINLPDSIRSIADNAFHYCTGLKYIYLPDGISINASVNSTGPFEGCSSDLIIYCESSEKPSGWGEYWNEYNYYYDSKLRSNFGYTRDEFEYWTGLDNSIVEFAIPTGTKSIPAGAFDGFKNLKAIDIPTSVKSIGANAFRDCISLQYIYIPANVTTIDVPRMNCYGLSDMSYPFFGCSEDMIIYCDTGSQPAGWGQYWNNIKENNVSDNTNPSLIVNYDCTKDEYNYWTGLDKEITTLSIPSWITEIPGGALIGFNNITSLDIPDNVNKIGAWAFKDCHNLKSVFIPSTVNTMGYSEFEGCQEDTTIFCEAASSPSGWNDSWKWYREELINGYALKGYSLPVNYGYTRDQYHYWTELDNSITQYTFEEGAKEVPACAFMGFENLERVVIPEGVTAIGMSAFKGCSSLKRLNMPSTITTINENAFYGCSGLKYLVVSKNTANIEKNAFQDCTSLVSVYIPQSVTRINGSPFIGCSDTMVIYCEPSEKGTNWSANWNKDNWRTFTVKYDTSISDYSNTVLATASLAETNYIYDRTEHSPGVVIDGLLIDEDFDVEYANNINAGTATVAVKGIGSFSGSATKEFIIERAPIGDISLLPSSFDYDGESKTPVVIVNDTAGTRLIEGEEYSVSYPEESAAIGSHTVSVKGIGNYNDEKEVTFEIVRPAPETCDHYWNSFYTEDVPATCSADGFESIHCKKCDTIKDGSIRAITKIAHKYNAWTTTTPATEIAAGVQMHKCTVCGYSEKRSIAQISPTLPAVKISKPKATKKSATIKWKKVSKKNQKKIAKIEIQYSLDKSFKTGVKTVYAKKSATSKKISKLAPKKTYYIRIRAYKSSGGVVHVSKWSARKSVKIK